MTSFGEVDVTVVLVSYNTAGLLKESIGRVRAAEGDLRVKIVVVDNASKDDSVSVLRRDFADCELIVNDSNAGFGRANNQALPLVEGRYVLLLNTDAFVSADTLSKTVAYMDAHTCCGILGVRLVDQEGKLQPSARYFPTPLNRFLLRTGLDRIVQGVRMVDDLTWDHASVRYCDWVPGCFYLVRKELIEQIGLFDPRYFLYSEEIDHCFAAKKAGWQVVFFPDTSVVHIGGESAKSDGAITSDGRQLELLQIESELLYFRKNHGVIGIWVHLLLTTLGDVLIVLRRFVRRRSPIGLGAYARHITLVWSLFRRTRWGTQPTR